MIKILFFIPSLSAGGAEKVLCNLVNHMDQDQFDITVQTIEEGQPEKYLEKGIRYRSISHCKSRFGKKLFSYWFRLLAELKLIYPLYVKDDYDIEVAYLECDATKVMAASTNKKALKLAWVHCDLQKAMSDPGAFADKTKKYYKKFDSVVCVSRQGEISFHELFGDLVETSVLYNTIDRDEVLEKAEDAVDDLPMSDKPLVVSLGRLSTPKHYMRLLKVHKRLLDEGIQHNLLILGEGPDRRELENYIVENHLQISVKLPGFKDNPYPYLKAADLLACSSIYECFSTFIVEGLILGKPIITTNVSGMKELLGESEYGFITENEDESFYDGMKKMLTDRGFCKNYSEKAKIRGRDFATKDTVKATEDFMISLLEEKMNIYG